MPTNKGKISSRSSESKSGGFVCSPHMIDNVWRAGIGSDEEESDPGEDRRHVHQVAWE
jgi:hypothetical protein